MWKRAERLGRVRERSVRRDEKDEREKKLDIIRPASAIQTRVAAVVKHKGNNSIIAAHH